MRPRRPKIKFLVRAKILQPSEKKLRRWNFISKKILNEKKYFKVAARAGQSLIHERKKKRERYRERKKERWTNTKRKEKNRLKEIKNVKGIKKNR